MQKLNNIVSRSSICTAAGKEQKVIGARPWAGAVLIIEVLKESKILRGAYLSFPAANREALHVFELRGVGIEYTTLVLEWIVMRREELVYHMVVRSQI